MVSVSLVTRWRSYAAFKPGPFIPADGFIGNCWSGLPGAARRRAPDPRASRVAFGQRLHAISIAGRVRAIGLIANSHHLPTHRRQHPPRYILLLRHAPRRVV